MDAGEAELGPAIINSHALTVRSVLKRTNSLATSGRRRGILHRSSWRSGANCAAVMSSRWLAGTSDPAEVDDAIEIAATIDIEGEIPQSADVIGDTVATTDRVRA